MRSTNQTASRLPRFINTAFALLLCCGAMLRAGAGALPPEFSARDGLPHARAKALAGGEVRVAFLGGSITAANGWRVHTLKLLRDIFPGAAFTEIYAAVSGTGSNYGAARLQRDVLRHKPDLLFVEFAVNDSGQRTDAIAAQMEGIVRQTWAASPDTDICFVYTVSMGMTVRIEAGEYPPSAAAMETIAAHYGIPSVQFGVEVARRETAGTLVFHAPSSVKADAAGNDAQGRLIFTRDRTHPTDAGHRLYAATLQRVLPPILETGRPRPHTLAAPLKADHWQRAQLVVIPDSAAPTKQAAAAWRKLAPRDPVAVQAGRMAPPIWTALLPGAAAEFRFKGTRLGLIGLKGADNGQFRCFIDGQPVATSTLFDSFSTPGRHPLRPWFFPDALTDAEHTVRIELLAEKIDKAAIMKKAGKPIADPTPDAISGANAAPREGTSTSASAGVGVSAAPRGGAISGASGGSNSGVGSSASASGGSISGVGSNTNVGFGAGGGSGTSASAYDSHVLYLCGFLIVGETLTTPTLTAPVPTGPAPTAPASTGLAP